MIDSGANATILSTTIFWSIPRDFCPELIHTNEVIVLADGREVPITGRANCIFNFGPVELEHPVLI